MKKLLFDGNFHHTATTHQLSVDVVLYLRVGYKGEGWVLTPRLSLSWCGPPPPVPHLAFGLMASGCGI